MLLFEQAYCKRTRVVAVMDTASEQADDKITETEDGSEGQIFARSSDVMDVGMKDDNTGADYEKKSTSVECESLDAGTQELRLDQDPSDAVDPEDLEMDDDDITSKLLSIQVLPRIPKRKPATDNSTSTSVGETSSYCSVLERVDSAPCSDGARFSNLSAAGWSRSNIIDRPPKHWNRRNVKDENAPIRRTVSDRHPISEAKPEAEVTDNKTRRATGYSAWSPDAADISTEFEQAVAADDAPSSLTGPLPTLPFDEQMRERARLRNFRKHNSSTFPESVSTTFDSGDDSKDGFDLNAESSVRTDKASANMPFASRGQQNLAKLSSLNNAASLSTESTEHRRLSHQHVTENGHPRNHWASKPSQRTSEVKSNLMNSSAVHNTKMAQSLPKSKKEASSPPLPHLPVLPLFATTVSETSNHSSRHVEQETARSGKKSASLSSSKSAAQNDAHDMRSAAASKLKPANSAAAAGAKSVTFNCNAESHEGGATTRKLKTKVRYVHCLR